MKASLSVTKKPTRSKSAKTSITFVFILGESVGEFALRSYVLTCLSRSSSGSSVRRDGQAKLLSVDKKNANRVEFLFHENCQNKRLFNFLDRLELKSITKHCN